MGWFNHQLANMLPNSRNIVGVYIPIIWIPTKCGMSYLQYRELLDPRNMVIFQLPWRVKWTSDVQMLPLPSGAAPGAPYGGVANVVIFFSPKMNHGVYTLL